MQIKGTLNAVFATEQVTDKFRKRVFWLDIPGEYPQTISLEFTQDKCSELDRYKAGDEVEVEFNLRGRISKDKCWNTLQAWKIKKESKGGSGPGEYKGVDFSSKLQNNAPVSITQDDQDLPF
jgi:hypothetical protein